MENEIVLKRIIYPKPKKGWTNTWGEEIRIIGEEESMEITTGEIFERYIYNYVYYNAANGKPFIALKRNIQVY